MEESSISPNTRRTIWIVVGALAAVLVVAGLLHLAFTASSQLYLNLRETDEKQTKFIFELEKRVDEIERKLAVFEANLRYEATTQGQRK
jgi:hypothetical protein